MKSNTVKTRKILRSYLVYRYDEHNIINTNISEKHRIKILNGFLNNIIDNFHPNEQIALAINLGVLIENFLEEKENSLDDIAIIFTNYFFNEKIIKAIEAENNMSPKAKQIFDIALELYREDKKLYYLFANKRFFIETLSNTLINKSLASENVKYLLSCVSKTWSEDLNF